MIPASLLILASSATPIPSVYGRIRKSASLRQELVQSLSHTKHCQVTGMSYCSGHYAVISIASHKSSCILLCNC